ncbi:hypothetical protein AXF42_Ash020102 [Apostasia shenzhenica]|uniref:DUF4283 domain-containing protein n=1 Tax=Apostasia shenzhenica TaxID=1088818 RepID=A0A2I0A3N4_9ASPA|nr:hypothetical protein AXF42_Ash020102 [Apostasia shenzhenica]
MNGLPTFSFSEKKITNMAKKFRWIAVSKFPIKRPTMDDIMLFFASLGFVGSFQVGLYDQKHILIRFALESDFNYVTKKETYYMKDNIPIKFWKCNLIFGLDMNCLLFLFGLNFLLYLLNFGQVTSPLLLFFVDLFNFISQLLI